VKRGIGTIRQDLNISISKGARVEIKGVQDLNLIPKIIEYEVERQRRLLEIRDELVKRNIKPEDIEEKIVKVTEIFNETNSKLIRRGISEGKDVYAVKLKGFAKLLGREIQPNRRLATEMMERAKLISGVKGLIHTDELPGYGISEYEIEKLRRHMNADDNDAIVMVIGTYEECEKALKAIVQRAKEAIIGVPEETRSVNDDGTTRYSRPMPGAARMYPETDVRPIQITKEWIEKIKSTLPELPENIIRRYTEKYGLSLKLAEELIDAEKHEIFEEIINKYNVNPTLVASTLVYTMNTLKNEGLDVDRITRDRIMDLFNHVEKGSIAKEAIPEILKYLAQNPLENVENAIKSLGKIRMDIKELEEIVRREVDRAEEIIKSRGMASMNILMGRVMNIVRGRIDGKIVSETVKRILEEKIKSLNA